MAGGNPNRNTKKNSKNSGNKPSVRQQANAVSKPEDTPNDNKKTSKQNDCERERCKQKELEACDSCTIKVMKDANNIANRGLTINTILTAATIVTLLFTAWAVYVSKEGIEKTQKQFEILNEPFLGFESGGIGEFYNLPLYIGVTIKNFNGYPVNIIKNKIALDYDTMPDINGLEIDETEHQGQTIAKDHPYMITFNDTANILTDSLWNMFMTEKKIMYIRCSILYENNSKKGNIKKYVMLGRMQFSPQVGLRLIKEHNSTISE